MRDVAAEVEEFCEDDVEDGKHEEGGAKDCPKITEDGALIAELEIGFDEFSKQDAILAAEDVWHSHNLYLFLAQGSGDGKSCRDWAVGEISGIVFGANGGGVKGGRGWDFGA